MGAAVTIARKDLTERIRDRSALIIAFVVPLGLAFIINATIGGAAEGGFSFSFAVADADGGEVAAGLTGIFEELEQQGVAELRRVPEATARALADDNEVSASIVIPAGFSDAVTAGRNADITVVLNPDAPIGGQVARSIVEGFAAEVDAVQLSVAAAVVAGAEPASIPELAERAIAVPSPVALSDVAAEGGAYDFTTFYATGMAVFFVFFSVQFGILSLIGERETGTMQRLAAAPISPRAIILGKTLAAFVLGLLSMVVLWLATSVLMGARWGSPIGVIALITAGVLAAMGITALVSSFARTAEQAGGYASAVAVVLGILGGVFFPVSIAAGFLANLSLATPHHWLMDGFRNLSAGDTIVDVLPNVGAVLAFAVVTGAIGLAWAARMVQRT